MPCGPSLQEVRITSTHTKKKNTTTSGFHYESFKQQCSASRTKAQILSNIIPNFCKHFKNGVATVIKSAALKQEGHSLH
jgi:hypothetical protein